MGIQSSIPTLERNGAVWLAGEASGDFIASLVIPEVAKRMDGAPQYGVGGDKMRAAGFRAWYDVRELSVRGYIEVLTHLPRLLSFRKDLITRFGDSMPQVFVGGFRAWYDVRELSVRGYIEVLTHLPRLLSFRKDLITRFGDSMPQVFVGVDAPDFNLSVEEKLRRRGIPTVHFVSPSIWAWRPERIQNIRRAVFVGVDAPDFNLSVEEKLRRRGIPTVHFVSPSIWAWRPERIQNIRRAVDHMLLVFPFEEEIYRKAGIPATFVGHPLAGIIPMEPDTMGARQHFGLPDDGLPVITVMPGSRVDEVKGCGPVFFEAVERLLHRQGDAHVLIPAIDEQARNNILCVASLYPRLAQAMQVVVGESHRTMEAAEGDAHVLIPAIDEQARNNILCVASLYPRLAQAMQVVVGESHRTMEAADAVLVASGTAALECALFKKPMVVGYKMPAITGMIMQK